MMGNSIKGIEKVLDTLPICINHFAASQPPESAG